MLLSNRVPELADVVIVGGGFYGCSIALYLAQQRGFRDILILDKNDQLFARASRNNQARVHNGYHYPRDFTTAYRSRFNLPRFLDDWNEAIRDDFTSVYAVAKRDSRITARQFRHFCKEIRAPIERANSGIRDLFNPALIDDVFLTRELVFDAEVLHQKMHSLLSELGIRVGLQAHVSQISKHSREQIALRYSQNGAEHRVMARYVFNCSYSGLNQFYGDFPGVARQLVHEIAELALVAVPPQLEGLGITVIDGPFFSLMPFPSRGLYSLSHVRYTPHCSWPDRPGIDPYQKLDSYKGESRFERMQRDITRFIPSAVDLRYTESLFEIKTIMSKNSANDGRPILLDKHPEIGACYSILGGKIDNIYDVCEGLDAEPLDPCHSQERNIQTSSIARSK